MSLLIKVRGGTSQSLIVFIPDASSPDIGKTGLLANQVTLQTFRVDDAGRPINGAGALAIMATQTLTALASTFAAYSSNGWIAIGRGLYRWDPPDALLGAGATNLVAVLSGSDMADTTVVIPLAQFDTLAAGLTDAQVADKVLGRSLAGGADGGRTVRDALRFTRNRVEITGTGTSRTVTVYGEDDTTVAWTATYTIGSDGRANQIDPS